MARTNFTRLLVPPQERCFPYSRCRAAVLRLSLRPNTDRYPGQGSVRVPYRPHSTRD